MSLSHPRGCRCAQHFGLAEYMAELTGKDYALPHAPLAGDDSHIALRAPTPSAPSAPEQLASLPADLREELTPRQPWQPRPARKRPVAGQSIP